MTTTTTPSDIDLQATFSEAMDEFFGDLTGTVGVMARQFATGLDLVYNHEEIFPTASTLKVPILYTLYRQAEAGKIDLTERVTLRHADRTPGSGVLQNLDEGLQPTIRDIAELMIIVSDNWATDILFDRLGKETINQMMHDAGLSKTHLPLTIHELFSALADVDPTDPKVDYDFLREYLKTYTPAPDNIGMVFDERNDTSTPADMIRLLGMIDQGEGISSESREGILRIMKHQNFGQIIPWRLPTDQKIESAHKTGSLRGVKNDVGIVSSPKVTYGVAFMSKGQEDIPEVVDRMSKASRWIWDHLSAAADDDATPAT